MASPTFSDRTSLSVIFTVWPEMKRGGRVRLSNNRDTMMLEINNKRIKPVRKAAGGAINADDLILEERPL